MWAPLASPLSRTHRQVGPVLLPLLFPLHDNQTKPAAAKNRIRGIGRKSSRIRKRPGGNRPGIRAIFARLLGFDSAWWLYSPGLSPLSSQKNTCAGIQGGKQRKETGRVGVVRLQAIQRVPVLQPRQPALQSRAPQPPRPPNPWRLAEPGSRCGGSWDKHHRPGNSLRCRPVRLIGQWCVAGEWWSCSWARRSELTTGVVANCSSKQRVPGGVAMRRGRSCGRCDSWYVAHPLVRTVTRFILRIPMLVFTTGIRLGGAHRWSTAARRPPRMRVRHRGEEAVWAVRS
jgi:hypothetical protein